MINTNTKTQTTCRSKWAIELHLYPRLSFICFNLLAFSLFFPSFGDNVLCIFSLVCRCVAPTPCVASVSCSSYALVNCYLKKKKKKEKTATTTRRCPSGYGVRLEIPCTYFHWKQVTIWIIFPVGSEFDFVIISLVRSLPDSQINHEPDGGWLGENLGFVTDEHQINVALTRAKRGLVIIGKISSNL